jgi:MFS family permease
MDKETGGSMSKVLLRIVGSILGLLAGGVVLGLLSVIILSWNYEGDPDEGVWYTANFFALGFLVGAVVGAAAGATITEKAIRQRSSFWRALLGALLGSVVPLIGTVAGAVIGSGWKAKRAEAVMTRPQQGVVSLGDTVKQPPGVAKCPFCQSTAFRVVEETGSRRCSECRSVLPGYMKGNG